MTEAAETIRINDPYSKWVVIDEETRAKWPTLTAKHLFFLGLLDDKCQEKMAELGFKHVAPGEPSLYSLTGIYPNFPTFSGDEEQSRIAVEHAKQEAQTNAKAEFARRYPKKKLDVELALEKSKYTQEMNTLDRACVDYVFPELARNKPLRTALRLKNNSLGSISPQQFAELQDEIRQSGIEVEIVNTSDGIRTKDNHGAIMYRPAEKRWVLQLDLSGQYAIEEYIHELAIMGMYSQIHAKNAKKGIFPFVTKAMGFMGMKSQNTRALAFLDRDEDDLTWLALTIFDHMPTHLLRLDI